MKFETFETIALTVLAVGGIAVCTILDGCSPTIPRSSVHARHDRETDFGIMPKDRVLSQGSMTDAACVELLDQRDGAQLAGKILAGVGGVSALATAPDSVPEGARWGIGAGAATAAAVGVAVIWYGERKSDEFERYCEVADESEEDAGNQPVEGSAVSDLAPSPFGADGWVE